MILFISDILLWFDILKWIFLFFLAYYYYNWAREHLPFSPLLAVAVGLILVYYLVIEHPFVGAFGYIGWAVISSGALLLIPSVHRLFNLKKG
ncbi:hypothetical protein HY571_02595 [Candidatus Micrarchaeota archaeon]|nr:hypothetical protein [Candidatus Micrarchaeota archaeon]